MHNSLPLFYYPTTILWIDDDPLFLETVKVSMHNLSEHQKFCTHENWENFFTDYRSPIASYIKLHAQKGEEDYSTITHSPVDFDITKIASLHNIQNKYNEITTIICDYNMPEINGLDILSQLTAFPYKKILLTGIMEDNNAIAAFNAKTINRFIRKENSNLINELKYYIKTLSREYFCDITAPILAHLEADHSMALSDQKFVKFFDQWCYKNKIKEFYLIDKYGSYLTIDDSKNAYYFVVNTEESLNEFTAVNSDNHDMNYILNQVSQRKKIPFFGYNKESWPIDMVSHEKYLYTPNIIEGRERYYWTAINIAL